MSASREDIKDSKGNVLATNVEVETFEAEPFNPSDPLKAAIVNGDVVTDSRIVEFVVKSKDGKIERVFRQSYTRCTAKNLKGSLVLPGVNGDESKIYEFVSARADATAYQPVYVRLRNAGEGPEKAIEKIKKALAGLTPEQKAAALAELGLA